MTNFKRPCLVDIHLVLRRYNGLIVHFSGTPKGAGSDFEALYPDDLNEVVKGRSQSGLSCSVVKPDDEFEDLNCANATGCIGVVLRLNSPGSLLDAHPSDCGSFMLDGSRQTPRSRDMTAADIDTTIAGRDNSSYNEWVIANFTPIGLFAAKPYRVSAYVPIDYPADMPSYLIGDEPVLGFRHLKIEDIVTDFPSLPIYSFDNCRLVCWENGRWRPIAHGNLYP